MTIKMIKPGELPSEKIYKGWCSKCGSEMEAKRSDLEYSLHRNTDYYSATCLLTGCGNSVNFNPTTTYWER